MEIIIHKSVKLPSFYSLYVGTFVRYWTWTVYGLYIFNKLNFMKALLGGKTNMRMFQLSTSNYIGVIFLKRIYDNEHNSFTSSIFFLNLVCRKSLGIYIRFVKTYFSAKIFCLLRFFVGKRGQLPLSWVGRQPGLAKKEILQDDEYNDKDCWMKRGEAISCIYAYIYESKCKRN